MSLQPQLSSCLANNSPSNSVIIPFRRTLSALSPIIVRSSSSVFPSCGAAVSVIFSRAVRSSVCSSFCLVSSSIPSCSENALVIFEARNWIFGTWWGRGGVFYPNSQQKKGRGGRLGQRQVMDAAAAAAEAVFGGKGTSLERVEASKATKVAESDALVSQDAATELIPEALVWASLNGLVVGDRAVENSGRVAGLGLVHAPLSLLPTPFPAEAFHLAVQLSTLFNKLVDKVSQDAGFLQQTLSRTQKADEFTARLLAIHRTILEEGVRQDIRLGLHRSDYMLDAATGDLLQVELNTISSSFSGLGSVVSKLHKLSSVSL